MFRSLRQSLLGQLLGVYLLFVAVVLGVGGTVNVAMQQQLRAGVAASDLALAEAIALDTDMKLGNARDSLAALAELARASQGDPASLTAAFHAFKAARPDIDRIYWLDPRGVMRLSVPAARTLGTDYSRQRMFQRAAGANAPIVEGGAVDPTTSNPVAIIATPVRDNERTLLGVIATNIRLADLGAPLSTIAQQQLRQQQPIKLSMLDERGVQIASPEREQLLQPALDALPGAAEALRGKEAHQSGPGPDGAAWLFSSAPVPSVGWAVVVQRPAADALAVLGRFNAWLRTAALLFAGGGLLFWLLLLRRVIQPLRLLAAEHRELQPPGATASAAAVLIARRDDEVGLLARSLRRLERDVQTRLRELRTLLETSSAVVGTLEPQGVVRTIIREVRRLVDVQAVAVLVPDDSGALRVLASDGLSAHYDRTVRILPDDHASASAAALHEGRPVQMLAETSEQFPPASYADGFRSVLAIPIISRHVGSVVLVVYRVLPRVFSPNDVDLLLTFANYATLALGHASLYERTDERLHEVARENERLYRHAMAEKQTLAALMGSMSDGLVLADGDGNVLYANPGAAALISVPIGEVHASDLRAIHAALRAKAQRPEDYDQGMAHAQAYRQRSWVLEVTGVPAPRAVELRQFDVHDETGELFGSGLLLRDVTREREVDHFKTTLLAAVGHELRTPLSAIKGHASTLLQDDVVWPPEEQRHFLETISAEADKLAQMVANLLDLSRFEAGLLPLHRAPQQLRSLVDRAVRRYGRAIPDLVIRIGDDLPAVEVDGPRIEVVLRNLLANAAAYGEGRVIITAGMQEQQVVVRVVNDGPGIAPDELPYIFERFYRAQRGIQRRSGGTGLGLAICNAFVAAHGGAIWAESERMSTTIAFTLPVAVGPLPADDEAVQLVELSQ